MQQTQIQLECEIIIGRSKVSLIVSPKKQLRKQHATSGNSNMTK